MPLQTSGIVLQNENLKSSYFLMRVHSPAIADKIRAGQFIMIKASREHSPLLRRPFSIYKTYPSNHPEKNLSGTLFVLYKNVGKGTQRMTDFKKGDEVDIIGPLGNGFSPPPLPSSANVTLIGGGVGIVSLFLLSEGLRMSGLSVYIGGKTGEDILCEEDFKKLSSEVFIATEDGGRGYKGTVIDLFSSHAEERKRRSPRFIYACGPVEMLKELAKRIDVSQCVCQVSLEARMACGFGACWGCVVRTKRSRSPYQRVCSEGPVFNIEDILWKVL